MRVVVVVLGAVVLGLTVVLGMAVAVGHVPWMDIGDGSSCVGVAAQTKTGKGLTERVVASACRDTHGRLLPRRAAAEGLAAAVWKEATLPVDELVIDVRASSDGAIVMTLRRGELERRFGSGPAGAVGPRPERNVSEILWFVLPAVYLVTAVSVVTLIVRVRRAGVVVMWLRR